MPRPGGLMKRLKLKERKAAAKRKRGTRGASISERRAKRNAQIDKFAAEREIDDLKALSSSSEGDAECESESVSESDGARQLNELRRQLNCPVHTISSRIDAPQQAADSSSGSLSGEETAGEDGNSNDEEPEQLPQKSDANAEDEVRCCMCNTSLEGSASGFACITCKQTFCEDCFSSQHPVSTAHKYVPLAELDEEHGDASSEADNVPENEESDSIHEDAVPASGTSSDGDATDLRLLDEQQTDVGMYASTVLPPGDPFMAKYILDTHGAPDTTPTREVQISQFVFPECVVEASLHARRALRGCAASPTIQTSEQSEPLLHCTPSLWNRFVAYRRNAGRPLPSTAECSTLAVLLLYADAHFPLRTWDNEQDFIDLLTLHALNHLMKAEAVIHANNAAMKAAERMPETEQSNETALREFRDRGFGKTRVLIVLPMRNMALKYVTTMLSILGLDPASQKNYNAFEKDFSEVVEAVDPRFARRSVDYRRLFEGNINDDFCFGINLGARGSSAHIYSHVLASKIVFCSPVGLRRRLEKNSDALVGLSSIEVCIIDQADVLLQQNWAHTLEIVKVLNRRPRDTTEGLSDIRRVYSWALTGRMRRHRQTVVVSGFSHAAFLALLRSAQNNSGRIVVRMQAEPGVLRAVSVPLRQNFRRFEAHSIQTNADDRYEFFTKKFFPNVMLPLINREVRCILYVPDYFDVVRLRHWLFADYRESFAELNEYMGIRAQRASLGMFSDLERPLLLLSERFCFFKRFFVKKAEVLVFYAPPLNTSFYSTLLSKIEHKSPSASVMCLYSKYDSHELSRLVGTSKAAQLMTDGRDAFYFVTS